MSESITLSLDFVVDFLKEPDEEKRRCKLLYTVISIGNTALVDVLLPNIQNKDRFYPEALFLAAQINNTDIMDKLLEDGASVNEECNDVGECPLHIAAEKGLCAMVIHLLKKGADINKKTTLGLTSLHKAGSASVIDVLLENGADLEAEDNCGLSPLHWAIETKRPDVFVEELLLRGAKLDKNKLKDNSFQPGSFVSKLIVKCQVANIHGDIAKLQPTKEYIDGFFEASCKEELEKLAAMPLRPYHKLHLLDLLMEGYKDLSFLQYSSKAGYERRAICEFYRSSNSCIYRKILESNLNQAGRQFDYLLKFSSNDGIINVGGHPIYVALPPEMKRELFCLVPGGTLKRFKSAVFN